MRLIEKYTGEKTYMFPSGAVADPAAVKKKFPACLAFAHIVETDEGGEVMFALQNLSAMRSFFHVDSSLDEAGAMADIQEKINRTESAPAGPGAEERQAMALETIAKGVSSEDKAAVDALLGEEVKA